VLSPIIVADVLDPIIVGRFADMDAFREAIDNAITELEENGHQRLLKLIHKQTGSMKVLSYNTRSLGGHHPMPSVASVFELPACGAIVNDDTPIASSPVDCPDCLKLLRQAGVLN
jgi:hypothetical protein